MQKTTGPFRQISNQFDCIKNDHITHITSIVQGISWYQDQITKSHASVVVVRLESQRV